MRAAELEALRRLAEARKAADLAALERLLGERRDCEAEIAAVTVARKVEMAEPLGAAPPELLAARLRWGEGRIAELGRRIGVLDALIKAARAAAAQSLGKDEALGELSDRAKREMARTRATRAERDAPPPEERRADFE